MADNAKRKRRWFQYSLRTLLVLVTLFAVACSWYDYEMRKAAKRRAAIVKIEKLGGAVRYYDASYKYTRGKPRQWFSWLRNIHGDEHLGNAVSVRFYDSLTDADLVHLGALVNLEELWFWEGPITDAGLVHLKGLTKINWQRLPLSPQKSPWKTGKSSL